MIGKNTDLAIQYSKKSIVMTGKKFGILAKKRLQLAGQNYWKSIAMTEKKFETKKLFNPCKKTLDLLEKYPDLAR